MSLTRIVPDCHFATVESPATVSESLSLQEVTHSGRAGLKNRTIHRSTKKIKTICETQIIFKANLRNTGTDHFKVFTLDERLRDSAVPCKCRAGVQDTVSETCVRHRPVYGPRGPQNAGEEIGTIKTAPEQSKSLRKFR